uniref:Uncharacterized protein n=1 Tax=Micrurus lemniscatus lemniscatus TaxID=129467 RepID=A0A2D4II10_MICLE
MIDAMELEIEVSVPALKKLVEFIGSIFPWKLILNYEYLVQPEQVCLYIWTSRNKLHCDQINGVLCSHHWSNSVLIVKTYPGADYGSGHELLMAKIRVKLCDIKNTASLKFNITKISSMYATGVKKNRVELLDVAEKMPNKL